GAPGRPRVPAEERRRDRGAGPARRRVPGPGAAARHEHRAPGPGGGLPATRGDGALAGPPPDAGGRGRAAARMGARGARPRCGGEGHGDERDAAEPSAGASGRGPGPAADVGALRGSLPPVTEDLFSEEPARQERAAGRGFGLPEEAGPNAPLADRMRPRSFEELVGQEHLLEEGSPIAL